MHGSVILRYHNVYVVSGLDRRSGTVTCRSMQRTSRAWMPVRGADCSESRQTQIACSLQRSARRAAPPSTNLSVPARLQPVHLSLIRKSLA